MGDEAALDGGALVVARLCGKATAPNATLAHASFAAFDEDVRALWAAAPIRGATC